MKTDNQTKAEWMRERGVSMRYHNWAWYAHIGDDPDKCQAPDIALGETEDDALENLAIQKHWELWK